MVRLWKKKREPTPEELRVQEQERRRTSTGTRPDSEIPEWVDYHKQKTEAEGALITRERQQQEAALRQQEEEAALAAERSTVATYTPEQPPEINDLNALSGDIQNLLNRTRQPTAQQPITPVETTTSGLTHQQTAYLGGLGLQIQHIRPGFFYEVAKAAPIPAGATQEQIEGLRNIRKDKAHTIGKKIRNQVISSVHDELEQKGYLTADGVLKQEYRGKARQIKKYIEDRLQLASIEYAQSSEVLQNPRLLPIDVEYRTAIIRATTANNEQVETLRKKIAELKERIY